ncbi:MAG: hypothetical protein Faunusvirus4_26 [Faunusvirus sp.]|uniref:Uncharacterized protein n=1 Tax=Faunusvirus sp. TaxID=2487766 RepID=A0A3G4ZWC1_9VIRU|nr:MAG: hypothetical protein Faunusvirus4_26 [Faunusvirus sp.]
MHYLFDILLRVIHLLTHHQMYATSQWRTPLRIKDKDSATPICIRGDSCRLYKLGKCRFIHYPIFYRSVTPTPSSSFHSVGVTRVISDRPKSKEIVLLEQKLSDQYDTQLAVFRQLKTLCESLNCTYNCFTADMVNIAVPKMIHAAFIDLLDRRFLVDNVVGIIMNYAVGVKCVAKCRMPTCKTNVWIPEYGTVGEHVLRLLPVICDSHIKCNNCNGYCAKCNWRDDKITKYESTILVKCIDAPGCNTQCDCNIAILADSDDDSDWSYRRDYWN